MNFPETYSQISSHQLDSIVQMLATTMEARDSLQNILDTMVNAVLVLSPDSTIQRVNQAACSLLGYSRDSLSGRPVEDFFSDDLSWKDSCLIEVECQGAIRNREAWLMNRQGQKIPVLLSASVLQSRHGGIEGYVCAALDMSEHIKLRKALQSSRESFQAIVEKSADGILILRGNGKVEYLNQSAITLLGRDEAEMIGMPFGFPVVSGNATEVDVIRKNGELGIAEMRAVGTIWNDHDALLVSLRDVTENVRLREQLRQISMEDDLTGLNNRRGFLLHAEQELRSAERLNAHLILFFMDLDGMKRINDKLGHKFGDQALIETASIMRQVFRKSDILCRLGGDEFLALSLQMGKEDRTSYILSRFEAELSRRNMQPGRVFQLSISVGSVLVSDARNCSVEDVIRDADAAMYQKKMARKCLTENGHAMEMV
ncbi:MAG: diguanylate cyclase [Magnetococcales bacterium]|nr:diguanylate cyclase [Magnetococcales bacterium]